MAVNAVLSLDQGDLDEKLIGIKKVTGGALQDSLFVNGVAFKKTFSYAGFEQQPKSFKSPKIVCLNVELELKSEKDNAEVRVDQVSEYQAIVDAEWQIIYDKMEALYQTGAKVVLSKLPIGDLATQFGFTLCNISWRPSLRLIGSTGISRIGTSFALVVCPRMTWSVSYRRRVVASRPPVPTSNPNISAPATGLRSDRSAASALISLKAAQRLRRAHSCCAGARNSSSPRWSGAYTTPS